jgi:sugar lactone lactonase YvrE
MSVEVDTLNHCVRVNGATHGKQGRGPGEFHYPSRAAVVGSRAYVADSWNHRVQVFDLPGWKFAFEFGDFFCPNWIGVVDDRDGAVLAVVDTNNARVCFHHPDGRRVAACEFKSRRFPIAARLVNAETLEVYFEDDRVETISVAEVLRPSWWTTKLVKPISLARDRNGLIYVSDIGRSTVETFDSDGNFIAQVLGPDLLREGGRLLINGDDLIVTDRPSNAVFIYDIANRTHRKLEFDFDNPGFLGRDPEGRIWIGTYREQPDQRGARFEVFTPDYEFLRTVNLVEAQQPTSVSFADDRILIADQAARNVLTFLPDTSFSGFLRDKPYDLPVWCVVSDGESHIYVGAGPITDILRAEDLHRMYYVDFENAAVRYREDAPITL